MNKKFITTYLLIGLLIALGGLYYYTKLNSDNKSNTKKVEVTQLFANFNEDEIDEILINSESEIKLLKQDNIWYQVENNENKEANEIAINSMLNSLKTVEVEEAITNKEDKQALFEVDGSRIQVIMKSQNTEKANFFLGKSGPGFLGEYIRMNADNNIYEIDKISSNFNKANFLKAE